MTLEYWRWRLAANTMNFPHPPGSAAIPALTESAGWPTLRQIEKSTYILNMITTLHGVAG
jgi:hypothetical protein